MKNYTIFFNLKNKQEQDIFIDIKPFDRFSPIKGELINCNINKENIVCSVVKVIISNFRQIPDNYLKLYTGYGRIDSEKMIKKVYKSINLNKGNLVTLVLQKK